MSGGSGYALGYSEDEFDRLVRQAARFRDVTAVCFRTAGVSAGHRVLDLGSGLGDVAMLAADIVGTTGHIVGVERDPASVAIAVRRAAEAGLTNTTFVAGDIADDIGRGPFDAVIGRFILQFVPDPVAVVRSAANALASRGIVAIQEVFWRPALAANAHLALWSACAAAAHAGIVHSGADPAIGSKLYRIFIDAGLPAPHLRLELLAGTSADEVLWPYYLLRSLRSRANLEALGDFATLADRIVAEARDARSPVMSIAVASAWVRLPAA